MSAESLADLGHPSAWTGACGDLRAKATTIEFPELDIRLEQGTRITTPRGTYVFDYAIMNETQSWAIVYEHGPGGHGHRWLLMQLRRGEWTLETEVE